MFSLLRRKPSSIVVAEHEAAAISFIQQSTRTFLQHVHRISAIVNSVFLRPAELRLNNTAFANGCLTRITYCPRLVDVNNDMITIHPSASRRPPTTEWPTLPWKFASILPQRLACLYHGHRTQKTTLLD
jgi:hypothetical protein